MVKATLIVQSTRELVEGKTSVPYPSLEIVPLDLDGDLEWLIDYKEGRPTYDPLTEKLVRTKDVTTTPHPDYPAFSQYRIWFDIVALSVEELEELEDQEAGNAQQEHIQNGIDLFSKTYKKIWRKKNKATGASSIGRPKARRLMLWFRPVYMALNYGDWADANDKVLDAVLIQDIANEADSVMTNIYEFLRDEIALYLNDYDL